MTLTEMIQVGRAVPLLLFGFALVLGALHGLERVQSKTIVAVHIVAMKGTVCRAMLRGILAVLNHFITVWVLAFAALTWGIELIGEKLEPRFMVVSDVLVLAIAVGMLRVGLAKLTHDDHHPEHLGLDCDARAQADEIEARLPNGRAGTRQTNLFGHSGGLILRLAANTVFIQCLYLGRFALGITIVSALSIGRALTLIGVDVVTASGLRALAGRSSRFDTVITASPWGPALLIIWTGRSHVDHGHAH